MTLTKRHAEWAALALWLGLVGVVFWQTKTDFVEQGIAGGDAFHNAAFFPEIVALVILACSVPIGLVVAFRSQVEEASLSLNDLRRPLALLGGFALYLVMLSVLGYHIATVPFLVLVIWLCGDRRLLAPLVYAVLASVLVSQVFERYLNVVLPRGLVLDALGW